MKIYVVVLSLVLLAACGVENKDKKAITPFFDLKGYFEGEISRLEKANKDKELAKSVTVNGKIEEKKVKNLNFREELASFINSDINRPAWLDKYQKTETDSTITYETTAENLKTVRLAIQKKGNLITQIEIFNRENSQLTKSEQRLTYTPQTGYTIATLQDFVGASPNNIAVKVIF